MNERRGEVGTSVEAQPLGAAGHTADAAAVPPMLSRMLYLQLEMSLSAVEKATGESGEISVNMQTWPGLECKRLGGVRVPPWVRSRSSRSREPRTAWKSRTKMISSRGSTTS
jgi:hypothetical protein